MRRAIFLISAVLVGIGVAVLVFMIYNAYEEAVSYDDFIYDEIEIDESGNFKGRFQVVNNKLRICDYSFKTDGETLFLTLKATSGTKPVLPIDDDGYVTIEFKTGGSVESLIYIEGGNETELIFTEPQGDSE